MECRTYKCARLLACRPRERYIYLQAEGAGISAGLHVGDRIVAIHDKVGTPCTLLLLTTYYLLTYLLAYLLLTDYRLLTY